MHMNEVVNKYGMILNLTKRCDQHCDFCYLKEENIDIPLDNAMFIIEQHNNNLSQITLTGGEPFLYPHVKEILAKVSSLKLKVNINTNAKFGIEKMISCCDSTSVTFWISYSEYTTVNSCEIEILRSSGHKVFLSVPLIESLDDNLAELKKLTKSSDGILLLIPTPSPNNGITIPGTHAWFHKLAWVIDNLKHYTDCIYYEPGYRKIIPNTQKRCLAGHDIHVNADGLSYPCCLVVERIPGNSEIVPISIEDDSCPLLFDLDQKASVGYQGICPLFVRRLGVNGSGGYLDYLYY